MATTATLSALLRSPNDVIAQLRDGDVVITRRDAEPLRLSPAGPAAREIDTLSALAQLIAASLDDETADRIASHLAEPFPWTDLLPSAVRREFVAEFLRTARACASVARFDRLTIVLNSWRATAEAYAEHGVRPDGTDLAFLGEGEIGVAIDPRQ